MKIIKRFNRIDIDSAHLFTSIEYKLLDRILYQSNLTHSNGGQGFKFHVRKLAELTGISTGSVSNILKRWDFISKVGLTKDSEFIFDYSKYLLYMDNIKKIVQPVNNKSEKIVQPVNTIVQPVNNDCSIPEVYCSASEPRQSTIQINNTKEYTEQAKVKPVTQIPETSIINYSIETLLGKIKEKKNSESPESKLKEEQESQYIRSKLFEQLKLEEIKRVNISGYVPSDSLINQMVNRKLRLGYKTYENNRN